MNRSCVLFIQNASLNKIQYFDHQTEQKSIVPLEWRQRDSILWNVTAENKWRPRELERVWLINWFKQGFALQRSTMKFKRRKMRLPTIIMFYNFFELGQNIDSFASATQGMDTFLFEMSM